MSERMVVRGERERESVCVCARDLTTSHQSTNATHHWPHSWNRRYHPLSLRELFPLLSHKSHKSTDSNVCARWGMARQGNTSSLQGGLVGTLIPFNDSLTFLFRFHFRVLLSCWTVHTERCIQIHNKQCICLVYLHMAPPQGVCGTLG